MRRVVPGRFALVSFPYWLTGIAALAGVAGCGGSSETLHPVRGRVTVDGQPLTTGTVSFRPDAAKGNTSLHHPTGPIDPQGNFELVTANEKGAPPGRYKVLVFADANATASGAAHPAAPKWLVNKQYTSAATTDLTVEVVADPDPNRYEFKLKK